MQLGETYQVKKVKCPHDIKVSVPGSKSITNRALLLAALAEGKSVLRGVLFSDDSRHFLQALTELGFSVAVDEEQCCVTVEGCGGKIPCADEATILESSPEHPITSVYVGSAGTAARFLTAFLGLSRGYYRMDASEQMKKRPMRELLEALEEIGAEIRYEEEPYHFPFVIGCPEWKKQKVTVDVDKSSQFLSALLISSVLSPKNFKIQVIGNHGMAYVDMTVVMMEQFGVSVGRDERGRFVIDCGQKYSNLDYQIEPDLSAACYFYAMSPLLKVKSQVNHVHFGCLQGDIRFLEVLKDMGCGLEEADEGIIVTPPAGKMMGGWFDLSSFSDQALTLAAIAPYADSKVTIANVGHIRMQECDRIEAILHNLKAMGIAASEEDGTIEIQPGKPKATKIATYEDHRVAMSFALCGLVTEGIEIENPSCCRKTFENYFEVLESVY